MATNLAQQHMSFEIEVRQLYRRLFIPAVVEQVKEEGKDVSEPEQ